MLTNYHTHTTRCGHAEGTEEEYILCLLYTSPSPRDCS